MDMGISMDKTTVNCSRLGKNPQCNISIFELQNHNSHAPIFSTEIEMMEYINRILMDVDLVCKKIDIALDVQKPNEITKLTSVIQQGYELQKDFIAMELDQEGDNDDNAQ
jgi:replicative DNA helicase